MHLMVFSISVSRHFRSNVYSDNKNDGSLFGLGVVPVNLDVTHGNENALHTSLCSGRSQVSFGIRCSSSERTV